jgi:hypothetical protein
MRKAILGTLGWAFAASVTFVLPRGWAVLVENVKSKKAARARGGGRLAAARFLKRASRFLEGFP